MRNNFETITTTDKARRDEIFQQFRRSELANERQAVKFSGCQPILQADGRPEYRIVRYPGKHAKTQVRFMYESTFSVAYPRELEKI